MLHPVARIRLMLLAVICSFSLVAVGTPLAALYVFQYTADYATFSIGQYYNSPNDWCQGYGAYRITDNVFNKPSGRLGRSAIISIQGNWLRSTADRQSSTWAELNGSYYGTVKHGFVKNIDITGYYGNGRVFTESLNSHCI